MLCNLYLIPFITHAAQVTLVWDTSTSGGSVAGYKIHYGTKSGDYDYSVDVGNYNSCTISSLQEGSTYYFAATAYNSQLNESELSEEIGYTIPITTPADPGDSINCTDCFKGRCDGKCNPNDGPNCPDCASSYYCGDGICDFDENQCECPEDCGTPPFTETDRCSDGSDNDCDELVDGNDPDCETFACKPKRDLCELNSECCSNWCHRGKCK